MSEEEISKSLQSYNSSYNDAFSKLTDLTTRYQGEGLGFVEAQTAAIHELLSDTSDSFLQKVNADMGKPVPWKESS
ncbi:MAG: hypothetical protein B7Y25_06665 [Alphaproteobacteria bacterium 16-39-46]|nr:MAG: hypothetical protein B7Y25_06665 [Alphaproteobacteria bacterium 16-39-46]OZA42215.1 MAG: hypothetical protein B7X84_06740 [Alphaproteobacteria bacterium 17-39-52]HQS84566.1 hypothetical protein [Alphaproteobacteria bacterium]HQS94355.1 hypothetical protein [Alphaproteobacteria bacterium]